MSKKSLIICICIALVLLAGICFGVMRLYSDQPAAGEPETVSHAAVLKAVPSDAAVVFCFQNARAGLVALDDRTKVFGSLLGNHPSFRKWIASLPDSVSLKAQPAVVSVHFSETLVPLMILETGHAQDTSGYERALLDHASACALSSALVHAPGQGMLLVSPSAALVESSCRHLESATSVLDDPYFAELSGRLHAREIVLFNNGYMGKLLSSLCQRPLYAYSPFLKGAAEWTGFELRDLSGKRVSLHGAAVSGRSPGYYANLLEAIPAGEMRFSQVVPASAVAVTALSPANFPVYVKAYEKWLDASQSLQKFRRTCDTLRAHTGEDPVKWLEKTGVREVAKAAWISESGPDRSVVLLRTSKAISVADGEPVAEAGFLPALFGEVFAAGGSACQASGEWLVLGSETALAEYGRLLEEKGSLQAALSDVSEARLIPSKGCKALFYFSASDAAVRYAEWFRPLLSESLKASLEGVIREPMILACMDEGLLLEAVRPTGFAEKKASGRRGTPGRKADVEIPSGPFEVTNSGTGKANLFYQAPNLSLCLKDKESGKGLWGVAFDQPICGAAACIDYYANGKLQFLFAAGSRLYLIDRLGRFVSGFPVELGKEVLLGPAVHDFTGAKGYTVLVLHRDNTIGMYDLHGVQAAEWKGITCEDTILSLPVLAKADGKRVWVVATAGGERVYDFWGGEPLKAKTIKNLEY
ncbi:MAG: hypothetical protein IJ654_09840 [Bacteroidales bacterium]|nr:hypothetical protein [Bacteroidales bacterium]